MELQTPGYMHILVHIHERMIDECGVPGIMGLLLFCVGDTGDEPSSYRLEI